MEYLNLRRLVCSAAQRAFRGGLIAGTGGNFSAFDPHAGVLVITPTSLPYPEMTPADIVAITLDGLPVAGTHRPSSEWRLHAAIYQRRLDVRAVVHTHSPYASAFAVLGEGIPPVLVEMKVFLGGGVPCAPYGPNGSYEVGKMTAEALGGGAACLMAGHGAVTVGATLDEALDRAIYLEDAAKIYHLARQVGNPRTISGM